jgi:hypothetical protein
MPCPAKELGTVDSFVAMFRFESKAKTFCSGAVRGWRVLACSAFGHGMPCPYCRKLLRRRKNDVVIRVKNWRSRCVVALAQAGMPVLLEGGLRGRTKAKIGRIAAWRLRAGVIFTVPPAGGACSTKDEAIRTAATRLLLWFGRGRWLWPGGRRDRLRGSRTCSE